MVTSSRLEGYLTILERALGPISVSEKAEIIMEIKSHVLDAQERDNTQSLESILSSLGEPEQVASRYLLERGLKLQKPPKHPVIKWLVLGFLGTVLILVFSVFVLIWKFTPLFKIDAKTGNVKVMGGLIDIGNTFNFDEIKFKGSKKINKNKIKNIEIDFLNASFEFKTSADDTIEWECVGTQKYNNEEYLTETYDTERFIFTDTGGIRCDFKIPANVNLISKGTNGKIGFVKPEYNVELIMTNGMVGVRPDDNKKYNYEFSALNSWTDSFVSSRAKSAYNLKISIINGTIKRF